MQDALKRENGGDIRTCEAIMTMGSVCHRCINDLRVGLVVLDHEVFVISRSEGGLKDFPVCISPGS